MNKEYLKYREKLLASSKRYYWNNTEKVKKMNKDRCEYRKLNNLCVDCGNKSVDGLTRCVECNKKHNINSLNRLQKRKEFNLCRICGNQKGNGGTKNYCSICCEKEKIRRNSIVLENKKKAIEILGSKCSICGLKTEIYDVYDFHHKNPKEKEKSIRELLGGKWIIIEKELKKCSLVCSNCHRTLHSRLYKGELCLMN
jgi:predicted HNH restriction endonuclease